MFGPWFLFFFFFIQFSFQSYWYYEYIRKKPFFFWFHVGNYLISGTTIFTNTTRRAYQARGCPWCDHARWRRGLVRRKTFPLDSRTQRVCHNDLTWHSSTQAKPEACWLVSYRDYFHILTISPGTMTRISHRNIYKAQRTERPKWWRLFNLHLEITKIAPTGKIRPVNSPGGLGWWNLKGRYMTVLSVMSSIDKQLADIQVRIRLRI